MTLYKAKQKETNMTESGLEMSSNLPQNSSISLPLAPKNYPRKQ